MSLDVHLAGLKEFNRAIQRNPQAVRSAAADLLTEGMAAYNRVIIRNPWRVGQSGGGTPTDTKALRDTHSRNVEMSRLRAIITPTAPYAEYVHDGTSRMKARPWLEYAKDKADRDIRQLSDRFLTRITNDLAK